MQKLIAVSRYVFALLAVVIIVRVVDMEVLSDTLRSTHGWTLVASFGLMWIAQMLYTYKWKILLAGRGIILGFRRLLAFNLVAAAWSTFLPGQIAGEAVKMVRLARGRQDGGALAASVVVDRVTGLIGILLLGLGGVLLSSEAPDGARATLLIALGIGLIGCAVGLVGCSWLVTRKASRSAAGPAEGRFGRIIAKGWEVGAAVSSYRAHPWVFVIACIAGVFVQLAITAGVYVAARAIDLDFGMADAAWVFALTSVIQLVPVTVGGLGTREAGFVGLMGILGFSSAEATALSLIVFAFTLQFAALGIVIEVVPSLRDRLSPPSVESES